MSLALSLEPLQDLDQALVGQAAPGVMVMLRRYRKGDEQGLELRGDFQHAWDCAGREMPAGPRWTLCWWESHTPVAIGGLEPLGDGQYGVWALTADLHPRLWAFARQAARRVLGFAETHLKARTFHAMACDTPQAVTFLRQLGFAAEGQAWQGPDGSTYIPMARRF